MGKITLTMTSQNGKTFAENLGYVNVDVMADTSKVATIVQFAKQICLDLTKNSYVGTAVTYEVQLDNIEVG